MNREQEQLVKRIATKLFRTYCPAGESGCHTREDLIHYGIIGLLKAKKNFKGNLNVPFNAYAAIRIKGEIMDAVRKSPFIRLPQKKREMVNQLNSAGNKILDLGRIPDIQSLARDLDWSPAKVLEVEGYTSRLISLDAGPAGNDPADSCTGGNAEQNLLNKDLARAMQACLESIDDALERLVFIAREVKEMTLKQVGAKIGWSIEKTRQAQIRAKGRMKTCLKKNGWDLE